jgi:hypothetical protein
LFIDTIIGELTLNDDDLKILRHPEWVFDEIFHSHDLLIADEKLGNAIDTGNVRRMYTHYYPYTTICIWILIL